jgi:hypothetical protein
MPRLLASAEARRRSSNGNLLLIVGVSGHRELEVGSAWDWVRNQITIFLRGLPRPLVGVTSLAIGADQIFAEIVVKLGGQIDAVIPFEGYERTFEKEADLHNYRRLKGIAAHVETLGPSPTDEEAYLRAGKRVVDRSELLVAVWDGQTAHGLGGTADIVQYAMVARKRLVLLNPVTRKLVD